MASHNFIKIVGYDGTPPDGTNPGSFECFQGLSCENSDSDSGGVAPTVNVAVSTYADMEITPGLWETQTQVITKQSEHLEWLKQRLGEQAVGDTGVLGVIKDFIKWLGKEMLVQALGEIIERMITPLNLTGEIGDDIADFIAEAFVEGSAWLIDFFEKKADPGVKLCESMLEENSSLLELDLSYVHYQFRKETITAHQTNITELESQLQEANGKLLEMVQLAIEIAKMLLSGKEVEEEEDGWDSVMSSLDEAVENLDEWMYPEETSDPGEGEPGEGDPVELLPSAPELPAIPEDGKIAVSRKIAYLLARYGFKLATEMIRRQQQADVNMEQILQAIKDLKYNDEILYLPGNARIHLKNKIIEY